ncbi:MAG TPA: hypothetical protein VNZ53_09665, partial [Steroidobacteraceae bacterium]|nr:hypothetical protein [Steroidobacteraceae bacterium]
FPRFQATPSVLAQGGGARQPELAAIKKHPEASFAMPRVVAIDNGERRDFTRARDKGGFS